MSGRFPKVPGKHLPDGQSLFKGVTLDASPILVRFIIRRSLVRLPRLVAEDLPKHPRKPVWNGSESLLEVGILQVEPDLLPFIGGHYHDLPALNVLDLPPDDLATLLDILGRELLLFAWDTPVNAILDVPGFGHNHVHERGDLEIDLHRFDDLESVEKGVTEGFVRVDRRSRPIRPQESSVVVTNPA